MAEQIVSCPGCAKKFRIPDGAPPGAFDCTACGASVAYGGAAVAQRAGGGKSRSGGRATRGRPERAEAAGAGKARGKAGGRSAAKAGAGSGGRRRSRSDAEPKPEEGGRRGRKGAKKENTTPILVVGIMGCVLLVGILAVAFLGGDDKKPADAGDPAVAPENGGGGGGISASDLNGGGGGGDPDAVAGGGSGGSGDTTGTAGAGTTPAPTPTTTAAPPPPASGIGDSTGGGDPSQRDYGMWFRAPLDELFSEMPPLEGTTDAEAEELRARVALFIDFDAGRDGMRAGNWLEKQGRKAMSFLLNGFVQHWKGGKWTTENEQWASWQIQQTARKLVQATKMPSDLEARFNPRGENDPRLFERAAKMWVAWWRGTGQYLKEFTPLPEEE